MKRSIDNNRNDDNEKPTKKSRYETVSFDPISDLERGVGITEYIALDRVKPFFAILKRHAYDFIVNEVDMSGSVVHLTETELPEEMREKELSEDDKSQLQESGYSALLQEQLVSEEKLSQIREFVSNYQEAKSVVQGKSANGEVSLDDIPSLILDAESDKAKRSKLHQVVKDHFAHVLISDATNTPTGTCIRLRYNFGTGKLNNLMLKNTYNSKQKKKQKKQKKRAGTKADQSALFDPRDSAWPANRPSYLQFVLYKEDKETTHAMAEIARILKLKPNLFSWAGTKDKRGCTSQLVTAFKVAPQKLIRVNTSKSHSTMAVGNFKFVEDRLLLGKLRGNQFTLALRNLVQDSETGGCDIESVDQALKTVQETGFINYFGMQRFGMEHNPTHKLGIHVLKSEWEPIVTKMLKSKNRNQKVMRIIDQYFADKDASRAIQALRDTGSAIETALLSGYARSAPNDHASAFTKLPKNLRTMFVHAYQSYIWNTMTSERLRKYGYKPVVGDLVLCGDSDEIHFDMDDAVVVTDEIPDESTSDQNTLPPKRKAEAKRITEEDLDKYTIEDIVLPIPGTSIIYPAHDINEAHYFSLMEKDGINMEHLKRNPEENSTFGAYRHIIVKAKDLSWRIVQHKSLDDKLVETDYDRLQGKTISAPQSADGQYTSLSISFTLPSSTYATMFIREVMKVPSARSELA